MDAYGKPDLLLFDLGGVLYSLEYELTLSLLERSCGKPYTEIRRVLYNDSFAGLEKGLLSPESYFFGVSRKLGCRMGFSEFKRAFNAFLIRRDDMFDLLIKFEARVPIHFLSNTNAINAEIILPDLGRFHAGLTLSYEVGHMKPEPEIYRIAMKCANVSAGAVLFIDDSGENVRTAEELGIRSHLYSGKTGLLRFLADEGVAFA